MFFSWFRPAQQPSTAQSAQFDEKLRQKENLTQADLLKEKGRRERAAAQKDGRYWHEEKLNGQTRRWNYRSEMVARLRLDHDHKYIWLSFAAIIAIGFSSFVVVKSRVIENRREQMAERERMRRLLQENAKQAGIV
ncbi:hypothetical protein M3Y99_01014600 [Aphelenchoides fujianensis]|nr:hypothetical protein M3Y99_01014600 [Aphelenchoides fujianensis]